MSELRYQRDGSSIRLMSYLCFVSSLPGWDVLGKLKRLLLGEQLTQFITYVWKHLIQQKRFKHIHQNVPGAALQSEPCGKSILENIYVHICVCLIYVYFIYILDGRQLSFFYILL